MDEIVAERMKENPTGRVGDSAEVGDACEFLCSAKISFIVGRNLLPDGGAFDSSTVRCICGRSVVGGSPAAKPPTAARTYRRESRLRSADATRPRYPPWPKIAMIALAALPWSSVASKPDADVVASGCIAPPPAPALPAAAPIGWHAAGTRGLQQVRQAAGTRATAPTDAVTCWPPSVNVIRSCPAFV
jgi:hypothetical protein